ncbi:hypothetical protein QBC47DRAFT_398674 [Echria macrotheca]|uniref:Uncharacterized protein n=1 Tax=Echria macrotheca TaxID=438768 RepID=A0AAJ0BME0_9PEZI|nr:hypothetical protein QBC47DRAFT_398674 [Echria macrotheca]
MALTTSTATAAVRAAADTTYFNFGPLTTLFVPATYCWNTCWVPGDTSSVKYRSVCTVYDGLCYPTGGCMPTAESASPYATWSYGGYFSPGLVCPHAWTTIASFTSGMSEDGSGAQDIVSRLSDGETAAYCCPSGFDIHLERPDDTADWAQSVTPPCCISSTTTGSFSYFSCDYQKSGGQGSGFSLGSTTLNIRTTIMTESASIDDNGNTQTWTTTLDTYTEIPTVFDTAYSVVPAVLLLWRSEDRASSVASVVVTTSVVVTSILVQSPPIVTAVSNTPVGTTVTARVTETVGPATMEGTPGDDDWYLPLSRGAFAGVIVTSVVVFAVAATALAWFLCTRRKRKGVGAEAETSAVGMGDAAGAEEVKETQPTPTPTPNLPSGPDAVSPLTPPPPPPQPPELSTERGDHEAYELHAGHVSEVSAGGSEVRHVQW